MRTGPAKVATTVSEGFLLIFYISRVSSQAVMVINSSPKHILLLAYISFEEAEKI
jgi:hypothetical protein